MLTTHSVASSNIAPTPHPTDLLNGAPRCLHPRCLLVAIYLHNTRAGLPAVPARQCVGNDRLAPAHHLLAAHLHTQFSGGTWLHLTHWQGRVILTSDLRWGGCDVRWTQ